MKRRQRRQFGALTLLAKERAQRRFNQIRHCSALFGSLAFELRHYSIVNVQSGLHMGNHTMKMVIRQTVPGRGRIGKARGLNLWYAAIQAAPGLAPRN